MLDLFIYQHCPYCVRPRIIADIKKVNYRLHTLANDDVEAHLKHIGKKQVPFLKTTDGDYIVESLDICAYLDELDHNPILLPSVRTDLVDLASQINQASRTLVYPRFLDHPLNQLDFPTDSAKKYFIDKKSPTVGNFAMHLASPSTQATALTQALLDKMAVSLSTNYIQPNQISYDDIQIFPILRNLTLIADLVTFPTSVMDYLYFISKQTNIALYL